jgi:glycosyltransferase involved in cell wall biosynthesis
MEIAFFTESYLPTQDGVAHVVSSLARELDKLGHRLRVYTTNPVVGAPTRKVEEDGISVVRTRSLPVPLYQQYRWALFPFSSLRGERFGEDVDVVHVHTPGIMGSAGFLASRRWDKPLVGTFHTNVWAMRDSFSSNLLVALFFRAAWWYTLGTYWRCDVATAPTDSARRMLEEHVRKPFARPVEVVPNGIEVDRFRPGIERPDWRVRCGLPGEPLITYLGRLTADKGIHRFLDAIADLADRRDFSAIVAGTGPEEPAVRARLAADDRLRQRVRYVGPVAEEEKPALLAQTDLFVLPSTSDTSSIALLEAMSSGAACVVSRIGGPGEMIDDNATGRLFDPTAPAELPAALRSLLDDAPARRRLSTRARAEVAATASIEQTARRFISLYELVLGDRGARADRHAG